MKKSQSDLEKYLNSKWILQTNREPVHTAQAPGLLFFPILSSSQSPPLHSGTAHMLQYPRFSSVRFFADRRYTEHSCSKSDTGSCTPSKAAKAHPDQSYPPHDLINRMRVPVPLPRTPPAFPARTASAPPRYTAAHSRSAPAEIPPRRALPPPPA